jgi:hypothetical protein
LFPEQGYEYKPDSIQAGSVDVLTTLCDGDNATCLQFLGGLDGTAPWRTHITFTLSIQTIAMAISVMGHDIGCGRSLFVGLHPGGITYTRNTMCQVTGSVTENGLETCMYTCSCPEGSCDLSIIHRPMSQPSDWKLCGIRPGNLYIIVTSGNQSKNSNTILWVYHMCAVTQVIISPL